MPNHADDDAGTPDDGPPVWRWEALVGEFCDAFIQATDLEGGQVAPSIKHLVRITRDVLANKETNKMGDCLGSLEPADIASVQRICAELIQAAEIDEKMQKVTQEATESMGEFLRFFDAKLQLLAPGERLVWPGGWKTHSGGHAIMFAAERPTDGVGFSLVVCNTGEGIGYHPSKAGYPKTR
jgi:hypothetical protein